jgi:hypothetical protein
MRTFVKNLFPDLNIGFLFSGQVISQMGDNPPHQIALDGFKIDRF